MSYSDFTLAEVKTTFHLTIKEVQGLFADVPSARVSDHLAQTLTENTSLALAINTEKARSELLIAPVLVELRKLRNRQIGLFSGIDFSVEPETGLRGFCDFLISRGPAQIFLTAPIVAIVEAKKEDIIGGIPPCIAEMVAAHKFNAAEGNDISTVYGIVTAGDNWKFLKLEMPIVTIDIDEYLIDQVGKILGILVHITS
jgi:hypothetical protein